MAHRLNHLDNKEDKGTVEILLTQQQLTFIALAIDLSRRKLLNEYNMCPDCVFELSKELLSAAKFLRDRNDAADVLKELLKAELEDAGAKLPDNEVEKRMFRASGKKARS